MWVTTPYKRIGGWATNVSEGYKQSVALTFNSVTEQLNPSSKFRLEMETATYLAKNSPQYIEPKDAPPSQSATCRHPD
jgi:hypothetical protein